MVSHFGSSQNLKRYRFSIRQLLEARNPEVEQLGIFSSREQTRRAMSAYCTAARQAAQQNDAAMREIRQTLARGQVLADAHRLCVEQRAPLIQVSFYWPLRDGK
ncbi:MAG: hypothetical protein E5Y55_22300 [Mesorhizobium sp.]|uniref:hypothetical protein n=1 Tax=Mesorhizobium sp. TaxID=1871066 RepID=UPI00122785DF|nr:hypothetical protein [Mesorhizobium sp.]TIM42362.1 MAG: hypothetical protein E5Y55_22300 [Mesorhizobium sp.]